MDVFKRPLVALALALPVLAQLGSWTSGGTPSLDLSRRQAPSCAPVGNPSFAALERLNNPFTFVDGKPVNNGDDWACRRQELSTLFQRYEFGTLPPAPVSVTASLSGTNLTINVSSANATTSFIATVETPAGNGPFPAMIGIGGSSLPAAAGIATISFNNREIALDSGPIGRGQGKFYDLYGAYHSAGTLLAWSWGVSRIIDALQTIPNSRIDATKIGVTGCSANGKAALVAGAFDNRLVLTIPVESGAGGAGCWRLSEAMKAGGVGTVVASELANTTTYFATSFNQYATRVNTLPFDHHLLAALVAPRGLLVIDNSQYPWLGPPSVFGCMKTAHGVFRSLGAGDKMGVSIVGGHDHCVFAGQQYPEYQAFINKFLRGITAENTNVMKTDVPNNGGFEEGKFVDWTLPRLIPIAAPPPPPPLGVCDAPAELDLSKTNAELNNPFIFVNGTKEVKSSDDWGCRRQEISNLFQRLELGYVPTRPSSVSGSLSGTTLTVNVGHGGKNISFTASITYPGSAGPYPAIIGIGGSSLPAPPEVAIITFNAGELATDGGPIARGTGKFYDLYGENQSAGVLVAWTWGVSRIIDALSSVSNSRIDTSKLAVTGCSGYGKAAMVAGAFEPRLALTIPVESGAGGAGCWRLSDDLVRAGTGTVTARELAGTSSYYSQAFNPFAPAIPTLPLDHHLLAALIAPRGLLVLDNSQYPWLGPQSVYGCMVSASKVFEALGYKDRLGVSIVGGHDHCVFPGQQYPEFQAFINKFLRGIATENTNVIKTDVPNNGGFDETKWVKWITPDLVPQPPAQVRGPPGLCDAPEQVSLATYPRLNDPFTFVNGSRRVEDAGDWFCRRQEIGTLFQRFELGLLPPQPNVNAALSGNTLTINLELNGFRTSFTASIAYPANAGNGPFAAVIAIGGSSLPAAPEIATVTFNNLEIAQDNGVANRGRGKYYDIHGKAHQGGVLMAWAWAASRVIDGLASTPASRIDISRLAVTGCSNSGKAALIAGAFDQRIALTIPVESGAGGAGCWRLADELMRTGTGTVTAKDLVNSTAYFSREFPDFANAIPTAPFDHHLLAAMVAPRGLLVLDNSQYAWLGPPSVYGCMVSASKVYTALGYRDNMGISIVGGHDHCVFPGQQYPEYQAFINRFLRNIGTENTRYIKTDVPNNGGFDENRWVNWTTPNLGGPLNPPPPGRCGAPATVNLTSATRLPTPFTFVNTTKTVDTADEWFCRRTEIADLFQRYELGFFPANPTVTGSLSGNTLTVNVNLNGRSTSFTATITYPAGDGPFPAIIGIGGSSLPSLGGIATINFNAQEIAVDNGQANRGKGKFYDVHGSDHSAGVLVAHSWAVSRIVDAVRAVSNSRINPDRIAVTGCSGSGKAALVAGAFDQRIALTIPVESGSGGAACWRITDETWRNGGGVVTAVEIANTTAYFGRNFNQYTNQVAYLPFDHHLLAGLVAPRGLLVLDNTQYSWLSPASVFGCMKTANKIFASLGFGDRMGVSLVGGHDHCVFPGQQYPELNAFVNRFLRGSTTENTNVIKTDQPDDGGYEEPRWVDWTVPRLP